MRRQSPCFWLLYGIANATSVAELEMPSARVHRYARREQTKDACKRRCRAVTFATSATGWRATAVERRKDSFVDSSRHVRRIVRLGRRLRETFDPLTHICMIRKLVRYSHISHWSLFASHIDVECNKTDRKHVSFIRIRRRLLSRLTRKRIRRYIFVKDDDPNRKERI